MTRFFLVMACIALGGCDRILGIDGDYSDEIADGATDPAPPATSPDAAHGTGTPTPGAPGQSENDASVAGEVDATPSAPDAGAGGPPPDSATGAVSPILQVYAGATTIASGASSAKVTIGAIDPSRAFVVSGTSFNATSPTNVEVSGQIANATDVVFARSGTSGTVAVRYYVAAFQSGVLVQRGSVAMSSASVKVNLPVAIDRAHSFPLLTYRNTGSNINLDDFVRAELTASDQLTLTTQVASNAGVVEWQVVSFDGARVQWGTATMSGSTTSVAAALPSAVDPSTTWLVLSNQVSDSDGTVAELLVSGRVISATQLAFTRAKGGATNQIGWYAISFDNGTTVQSTTLAFDDDASSASAAIAPVPLGKTIAATGGVWQRGGTTAITSAGNAGYGTFVLDLGAGSQITATRGASGGTSKATLDTSILSFF